MFHIVTLLTKRLAYSIIRNGKDIGFEKSKADDRCETMNCRAAELGIETRYQVEAVE